MSAEKWATIEDSNPCFQYKYQNTIPQISLSKIVRNIITGVKSIILATAGKCHTQNNIAVIIIAK